MFNTKNYFRIFFIALMGFVFFGISACHDESDDATTSFQVIHASPDAPAVSLLGNGEAFTPTLNYANATSIVTINDPGTISLDVRAILPDGTTPSVIGPVDLDLAANSNTLVIAANDVANIEPLVIVRDDAEIASDRVRVRIIHAAPDAPQVDIYVTEPDADLSNSSSTVTASFRDDSGEIDIPSGDYQIRITPAGSQTVLFDSGTVPLPGSGDLAILAIENVRAGNSPVQLLLAAAGGSSLISDTNTPADVRVIHASPDAPAVDVLAAEVVDTVTEDYDFTNPLVANLSFSNFTDFVEVDPAFYDLIVVPTGETTPAVIEIEDLSIVTGNNFSVYATGLLGSTDAPEAITPVVIQRDRRRIATEAKIDIVHASPAAGNVDIYVTEPGANIDDINPNFTNVPFRASTNFVSLSAGDYDVTVTATGTKTAAIGPATISLAAGGLYTAVARDEARTDADPDGLPLGLILLDDFVTQ